MFLRYFLLLHFIDNQFDKINHAKDYASDSDRCNISAVPFLETITSKVFCQTIVASSILACSVHSVVCKRRHIAETFIPRYRRAINCDRVDRLSLRLWCLTTFYRRYIDLFLASHYRTSSWFLDTIPSAEIFAYAWRTYQFYREKILTIS